MRRGIWWIDESLSENLTPEGLVQDRVNQFLNQARGGEINAQPAAFL
jgi:hypothetical protein